MIVPYLAYLCSLPAWKFRRLFPICVPFLKIWKTSSTRFFCRPWMEGRPVGYLRPPSRGGGMGAHAHPSCQRPEKREKGPPLSFWGPHPPQTVATHLQSSDPVHWLPIEDPQKITAFFSITRIFCKVFFDS
jgi:hypothetical protein